MNKEEINEKEYQYVCALAGKKLYENYIDILSKLDINKGESLNNIPKELKNKIDALIVHAKALQYVCILEHPSEVSDVVNTTTNHMIESFGVR